MLRVSRNALTAPLLFKVAMRGLSDVSGKIVELQQTIVYADDFTLCAAGNSDLDGSIEENSERRAANAALSGGGQ